MSDFIKREDALLECEALTPIDCKMMKERINDIPSAEKQGEWERISYSMTDYGRRCSLCHFKVGSPTNFCPNCGARMK